MPSLFNNHPPHSSLLNTNGSQSLLYKLAILKASAWCITSLACLIYFFLISNKTLGNDLIITITLGGAVMLLGLLAPPRIPLATPLIKFIYLFLDVLFLSAIIHCTGGIINPFTSSLLVPIALAVTLLPRIHTLILISIACGIYGYWLMSVDQAHMAHHNFSLHLYGMGINFLLSTILLTIFISHALESVKKHEKALVATREKMMKDEQLVGIASLTANTAHALGTPLQTLTIVIGDLTAGHPLEQSTLNIIKQQLKNSQDYLQQLVHTAKIADSGKSPIISLRELAHKIEHHYSLQPKLKNLSFFIDKKLFTQAIRYNESLFFAIINLIDNALQAAKAHVELEFKQAQPSYVILSIKDDGQGISKNIVKAIGSPFIHSNSDSKKKSLGLGYYLSSYTIEQNKGKLLIENTQHGGVNTEIHLPIKNTR